MSFFLPTSPELSDPLLGFRFAVVFLGKSGPAHLPEFRFRSVQGLSQGVELEPIDNRDYPVKRTTENLVLERGMPIISTYRMELQKSFQDLQFKLRNLMVMILNEEVAPISSYLFYETYPIKWSLSGLDAAANEVIVESLTLTYTKFEPLVL